MKAILKVIDRSYLWLEKRFVHPGIIANQEERAYNRLLFWLCLGIGGTRILMLLSMWGLTFDHRYGWNALQLYLLSFCGLFLKYSPSIHTAAKWLLLIGHARYFYAFHIVDEPLLSEALSALCIPIVTYYLGGKRAAMLSTMFVAMTFSLFVMNGNAFVLSTAFEPYYFDLISVVWAILGAGFVAATYQHQRSKSQLKLLNQAEATNHLLSQMQELTKSKHHVIAVGSHEVRNPLAVVLGRLELQSEREPWMNALGNSLHHTQIALNAIIFEIKQAIRLSPTNLLADRHRLHTLSSLMSVELQIEEDRFSIKGDTDTDIDMPGHMIAYAVLRILKLTPFIDGEGSVVLSYCRSSNQLTLQFKRPISTSMVEKMHQLQKRMNIREPAFRLNLEENTIVDIHWLGVSEKSSPSPLYLP